jgi:CheY-like chemotaxis protein
MEESFAAVARQSSTAVAAADAVALSLPLQSASSISPFGSHGGMLLGDRSVEVMSGEPRSQYDVVLMDHLMPRMNGSEATKEIRQRGYKGLIVGLTGGKWLEAHMAILSSVWFSEFADMSAFGSFCLIL